MRRPNILILYTDQQRWDALGASGNTEIRTPHLDNLARAGLHFNRYFVQNPVCMPSRASFLTGRYPSTLGITHMGVPVPSGTMTLPRLLHNYGYISANIGKLHFLPHANRDHRAVHPDYGFDHLEISDEPGCYADAYRAWVGVKAPDQLDHVSVGLPPATAVWQRAMGVRDGIRHPAERFEKRAVAFGSRSELTHTAFVAEQTIEFIQRHRHRPFLCIAGFYSPHSPWIAPQEFLDLYDPRALTIPAYPPEVEARRQTTGQCSEAELRSARQGYYAMVSEVDHHVGRILKALGDAGLDEDTVVVFTSDHGEWLGEHLRYGKGYPGPDCVTRVPLLIRWTSALAAPGRTVSGIVEALDVVPTLLECAGVPVPGELQGRSLLPALRNEPFAGRTSALTENRGWKAIRTGGFRYICESDGKESLYDLERDPAEYVNVAMDQSYASALAECRAEMLRHLLEAERPLPRIWPY